MLLSWSPRILSRRTSRSVLLGIGNLLLDEVGSLLESVAHLLLKSINVVLILLHSWENNLVVHGGSSESSWVEKVNQESTLQEEVEWDETQDDSGELVNDVESAKTHPVGEPLLVVIEAFGLKSHEAHECWVSNSNDVSDVSLANTEHD